MIKYSVTADVPCAVPGIGTFEAGETKELDDFMLSNFEAQLGYPAQTGQWNVHVRLTTHLLPDETTEEV